MTSHEIVEERQTERSAGKIHKRADAVLLRLAFLMIVVMMMVMMFMLVMMMLVFMLIIVFIRRLVVAGDSPVIIVVIVIFVKMVVVGVFHFVDPSSRTRYAVEIETAGLDEFVQRVIPFFYCHKR